MTRPQRVTVHWLDIVTDHGWEPPHSARASKPCEVETTGYLLERTAEKVVVASTWGADESGEEINGRIAIPAGCVVRVETLKGAGD